MCLCMVLVCLVVMTAEGAWATEADFGTSGVQVRILGHSGKIQFWNKTQGIGKMFQLEFNGLYELPPASDLPPTSDTLTSNTFCAFANQDFTFSPLKELDYPGHTVGQTVPCKNINFTSPLMLGDNQTTLTVKTYLFETSGTITVDGNAVQVAEGYLKFTVEISEWPFLNPANELILEMAVKTPTLSHTMIDHSINMGDGGFLVLASTAIIDASSSPPGTTVPVATTLIQSGQVGRLYFTFPSFTSDLAYDPIVYIVSSPTAIEDWHLY